MSSKEVIGAPIVLNGKTMPFSSAVRAGDFVFFSGIVAVDANGALKLDGDIKEQTRLSLSYLNKMLNEADCEFKDVVKASIFLNKQADYAGFNEVYAEFFPTEPPARYAVVTDFVAPGILVEIELQAYKPNNK